jgi:hypothetical protein
MTNSTHNYYGSNHQINVKNPIYKGVENIHDLYDALTHSWTRETCTARLRNKWTEQDYTCGQCAITAFIVQDIFGGDIYEVPLETGGVHCFNLIDGMAVDLASEQFGDKVKDLDYAHATIQDREFRMQEPQKKDRYELLKSNLKAYLDSNKH